MTGAGDGGPVWTLTEAADFLDPPVTAERLRDLVRILGIPPCGTAPLPPGQVTGRPPYVWPVQVIQDVHAANQRWLTGVDPLPVRRVGDLDGLAAQAQNLIDRMAALVAAAEQQSQRARRAALRNPARRRRRRG